MRLGSPCIAINVYSRGMLQCQKHRGHLCGTERSFLHMTTKRLRSPSPQCLSWWRPSTQKKTSVIPPVCSLSRDRVFAALGHRLAAAPLLLSNRGIRFYHNSANLFEYQRGAPPKQIALNRDIIALGKSRKWKEILQLYDKEKKDYDNVNYSTTFIQLGRIRSVKRTDPLFESFVFDLADKLDERGINWMGIRQAANVVHAIAKMQLKSSAAEMIVEFVAGVNAKPVVTKGDTQAASNIAWALGKLKCSDVAPTFFAEVEKRAELLVLEGAPQAVSNLAWACGTLDIMSPKLFAAIENNATSLVQEGIPQAIANTLWAFGKLQYHAPTFLKEVDARGPWLVETGDPQNIANSALAFAQLGYEPETFLDALAKNIEKLAKKGNEQNICNACYALCILDQCHSDALCHLWEKAMCLNLSRFSGENIQQLAQVYALCQAAGIKLLDPPQELLTRMRGTAQKSSETISRSQSEVSACLNNIGVEHEVEVSPFPVGSPFVGTNMLAIDMASKQNLLAIEFDGEFHFLREVGTGKVTKIKNGMTKAKRRFLQRMGWKVVDIHYLDWIEAREKGVAESFLRKELNH